MRLMRYSRLLSTMSGGGGWSRSVTLRNGAGVPGSSSVGESRTMPTYSMGQEAGRGNEAWLGAARDRHP